MLLLWIDVVDPSLEYMSVITAKAVYIAEIVGFEVV